MSCTIGEMSRRSGHTPDTLRYYERIGLLKPVPRDNGGRRRYGRAELERLAFIGRARKMNFSLAEIGDLLELRDRPGNNRQRVSRLAASKLETIDEHIRELTYLRHELELLLNLCAGSSDGCPILEALAHDRTGALPPDKSGHTISRHSRKAG